MSSERDFLEQYLSAYVDGLPLDAEIRQRLEQLLQQPEYGRLYRQEMEVRTLLRARLLSLRYPAPPELRSDIRRMLLPARSPTRRRWLMPAAAALALGALLLWYFGWGPFSHAAPPCFATALLSSLQELQQGKFSITPLHDTTAAQLFFAQHGAPTPVVFPYVEEDLQFIGASLRQVDSYKLPVLVYRAPEGWLLLAEAPERDFHNGRLWLDSTIWSTLTQQRWYWGCPGQPATCAFWTAGGMVCGLATTLPPEQVKQLLELRQ